MNSKASILSQKLPQYQPLPDNEPVIEGRASNASSETAAFLEKNIVIPWKRTLRLKDYLSVCLHGLLVGANLIFFLTVLQFSISLHCPYGIRGPELLQSMTSDPILTATLTSLHCCSASKTGHCLRSQIMGPFQYLLSERFSKSRPSA
jgi:hypothetical protein